MSNQLSQLLGKWYPLRDSTEWVLGTVYKTEGPCYRKAGAKMLFNGVGQQFGLLSGGCLESDIQAHAKRVMQTGQAMTLCYDGSDEDDISFQLGIGCGGTVHILLQLVNQANAYLSLDAVLASLKERCAGTYYQRISSDDGNGPLITQCRFEKSELDSSTARTEAIRPGESIIGRESEWFVSDVNPEPHLLIVGGGLDARPVAAIANELGWQTSLCDPRPANARAEMFPRAAQILRGLDESLTTFCSEQRVDAAIIMTHNVTMDAQAIALLRYCSPLKYMALLGPTSRKAQVLSVAGILESDLSIPISSPAGFDIGGELPESIALSMLAECHKVLFHPC